MNPENWTPTEASDEDAPESDNKSQEVAPSLSDSNPEEAAPVAGDQRAKPPSPEEPAAPRENARTGHAPEPCEPHPEEIARTGHAPAPCEPHPEEINRMLDELAQEEARQLLEARILYEAAFVDAPLPASDAGRDTLPDEIEWTTDRGGAPLTFAEVSVDPHARAITDAELASIHTPNAHATQEDAEDRRAAATFNPLEQALLGFSPAPSPIPEPHRMAEKSPALLELEKAAAQLTPEQVIRDAQDEAFKLDRIYRITNDTTEKRYIGQTLHTTEGRFTEHVAKQNYLDSYLARSMRKHGDEHFRTETLLTLTNTHDKLVGAYETHQIRAHESTDRSKGYNMMESEPKYVRTEAIKEHNRDKANMQWSDPAKRSEKSEQMTEFWSDPAKQAEKSEQMTKIWEDPAKRAEKSEQMTKIWEDPAKRAEKSKQMTRIMSDPCRRAHIREKATEQWSDPANRQEMSRILKDKYATDPEFKAAHAQRSLENAAKSFQRHRDHYLSINASLTTPTARESLEAMFRNYATPVDICRQLGVAYDTPTVAHKALTRHLKYLCDDKNMTVAKYRESLGVDPARYRQINSARTAEKISGALAGKPKSAEHGRHISEAKIGKPQSDAHRKAISQGHLGKPKSLEACQKLSQSRMGIGKGVPLTPEHRQAISKSLKGKPKSTKPAPNKD